MGQVIPNFTLICLQTLCKIMCLQITKLGVPCSPDFDFCDFMGEGNSCERLEHKGFTE